MPTLPTDISSSPPNYTPADHATHHDTAHGILNGLNGTYERAFTLHGTTAPLSTLFQASGGRIYCGVDATSGKVWSFDSANVYQVDSLTATNWQAMTMPPNCSISSKEAKVVVWTPPAGSPLMFLCIYNTVTTRYEVYSAPLVAAGVSPTWSSVLLQLAANGVIIPTAFRGCSTGLLIGEYTLSPNEIAAGPSVYRSTNGTSFSAVLGPLATTRHIHSIYEDPYSLGTIYCTVGDAGIPHWVYKSTDGGATFSPITSLDSFSWQSVSMGFDANYVWFSSDQLSGSGAYVMDRVAQIPKWASVGRVDKVMVPGGVGGRVVSDLVLTSSSTTATSASANFTAFDQGKWIMGSNSIPLPTFIATVMNSTTISLSQAATGSGTVTATICGDTFYSISYMAAMDPATGYFYVIANDASVSGTCGGLFVITRVGDQPRLLYPIFQASTSLGHFEAFIAGGYLWFGRYGPWPLLSKVAA